MRVETVPGETDAERATHTPFDPWHHETVMTAEPAA